MDDRLEDLIPSPVHFASLTETNDRHGLVVRLHGPRLAEEKALVCSGVREWRLMKEGDQTIRSFRRHTLLLPYSEDWTELYCNAPAHNPEELLGRLFLRHEKVGRGWLVFGRYFNDRVGQETLLRGPGLFAKGPRSVIHAYAECLRDAGVNITVRDLGPLVQHEGDELSEPDTDLSVVVLGRSYVIAEEFTLAAP